MRTAVVGHVEWVEFVRVPHVPRPGEIVHTIDQWEEPAGGGSAAAVRLHELSGDCTFFTALGDDELGRRAAEGLGSMGVRVEAALRADPTRRAITHVDDDGERTITVVGDRLAPSGSDDLPWEELASVGAVYFTAGDVESLRRARAAKVLVATVRVLPILATAGVQLDAVVGSELDPGEPYRDGDIDPPPRIVVRTRGAEGGRYEVGGAAQTYDASAPLGNVVDRYGAGDAFAAGLTFALGAGMPPARAIDVAARCGAAVVTGRGPYDGRIDRAALGLSGK